MATDTAHRHVETLMRRAFEGSHAFVTDMTSARAQLNVQGPLSRELLQPLTSADLSNEAFPFRTAREIDLGFARVLCVRITYLGELGYELYIPAEQAGARLRPPRRGREKPSACATPASRRWPASAWRRATATTGTTSTTRTRSSRPGSGSSSISTSRPGFVGRDAVAAAKAAGPPTRRLVQVLVTDPEPLLFHAEVVHRDGVPVGYVRAASYGHTLGGAVGLAMVERQAGQPATQAWLDAGTWEVDIAGRRYPAIASIRPLYDPDMKRVRA